MNALTRNPAKNRGTNSAGNTGPCKAPADFRTGASIFKALSNPSRLVIVDALSRGEHCVADLTALVGLDISTVSNHLSVLRNVGLVVDDRRGTQVFYTLSNPCVMNIFCCINEFHAISDGSEPE
jgi:DNA-binding transcriptional ArsR family regulator